MNYIISNPTIHTITDGTFQGNIYIQDGKISKISPSFAEDVPLSDSYTLIEAKGFHLYPGLIDVHTHLGLYDQGTGKPGNDANETSDAMTPHVRALDGVHPLDSGFRDAVKAGVTCVNVMPGSANIIGGSTSAIKTYGTNISNMIVKKTSGLKIAFGENPKENHRDKTSAARSGVMAALRERFYHVKYDISEKEKLQPRYKPIVKALERKIPVRAHAHRSDDINSAIRFAKEFNLDLRIEHCTEGHLIAEDLKAYSHEIGGLHVCVGPTMTSRSKVELRNKSWETYHTLVNNDVHVSITTDHPYIPVQYLNVSAAIAIREGMKKEDALRGITLNPAINLGINDRVGSIEEGKDADLVLWDGELFDFTSKPLFTMINGEIVYRAEDFPCDY